MTPVFGDERHPIACQVDSRSGFRCRRRACIAPTALRSRAPALRSGKGDGDGKHHEQADDDAQDEGV